MSVKHLQMRLVFELAALQVGLLGYLLLGGEVRLALGRWLGLYKSQSSGLRSRCTHSFNIIGVLLFSLLKLGC